jgi:hypothetical protein
VTDDFAIEGEDAAYVPCDELAAALVVEEEGAISGLATGFVARDQSASSLPAQEREAIVGSGVGYVPGPCLALFVAVGAGGEILTSPDGINWTGQVSGFGSSDIFNVTWSQELGLFVVVGASGKLATSPDGVTWTLRTSGFGTSSIRGVAWSPTLGEFIAVGALGKTSSSPDGVTWTLHTISALNTFEFTGVRWSTALGLYVLVGNSGGSGVVATSPNGLVPWTVRSSGLGATFVRNVAWSGSSFIVVGDAGTLTRSVNGVTWAAQSLPGNLDTVTLSGIVWGPGLWVLGAGIFAGVGRAATSPTGVAPWTERDPVFGNNSVGGNAWSPPLALLAMVGNGGKISTSPDGVTWTARVSGITTSIVRVAWSGPLP